MRIVIDLQGAQSASRFRGIGRYCLSLAKAMIKNRGRHEIIIALSGLFPETILPLRLEFETFLPKEQIRVWYAPGPVKSSDPGTRRARKNAEILREAFLAGLNPDIILISSLFEGYIDDAATSIGQFDSRTRTAAILYDLIPLYDPKAYLPSAEGYDYYFKKIDMLKKADLLLAISGSAGREALDMLHISNGRVKTISSAVDHRFCPSEISEAEIAALKTRYRITRRVVLAAPGGFDPRKNVNALILAYAGLPQSIRKAHQLIITGKGAPAGLLQVAGQAGLGREELVLTGYVPDEDLIALYRISALFVCPSKHEGFGLPLLEAMSCGTPAIGADRTSIPEVMGNPEALFDPDAVDSMTLKILQALTDDDFRNRLSKLGLIQARNYSWDISAQLALRALESCVVQDRPGPIPPSKKLKLAFVSPLPPERTGIADYSAELLPALSRYYQIDVIVSQIKVSDPWVRANCNICTADEFLINSDQYDRVLYHFGNSPFHQYMVPLLKAVPGVVCLHDFYLSGYSSYMEIYGQSGSHWIRDLYTAHGYHAVAERVHNPDPAAVIYKYPCNFFVLQKAVGIIVHSKYAQSLARDWYGHGRDWAVIPLLRRPPEIERPEASGPGLPDHAFGVCSFGALDVTKMNHRLLSAWLNSRLADDPDCYLIFVGEIPGNPYGRDLAETIKKSRAKDRIRITGWVSHETYRGWLARASVAVQLRAGSRGETSAAVMDCMNYGLPTIVNAHGSNAELPLDAVCLLSDEFEENELVKALETLRQDPLKQKELGQKARETILNRHSPEASARLYAEAIENFFHKAKTDRHHLVQKLAATGGLPDDKGYLQGLASIIARNQPDPRPAKVLFLDVSATCRNDLKAGIDRFSRSLLIRLLRTPPPGFRTEPVYLTDQSGVWHYRHARSYTLNLIECPGGWIQDDIAQMMAGDLLLGSDLSGNILEEAQKSGLFEEIKKTGVGIIFTIFDLLPIRLPHVFPPGADRHFLEWLRSVCKISDHLICISKSVAHDLLEWGRTEALTLPRIEWFHLGADVKASSPTKGLPDDAKNCLSIIKSRPSFLMVGTIEPRKGHLQTIAAFERLWRENMDVNLVIVGQEGWKHLPDNQRRTIPRIVETIRIHDELNTRLFWLRGISDEYLEKVYGAAACLIFPSEGEGFGLPLIEAAQHGLPIIARDIPVFREVAGGHAFYFDGLTPEDLADALIQWLARYGKKDHPKSDTMPWQTWRESIAQLIDLIIKQ